MTVALRALQRTLPVSIEGREIERVEIGERAVVIRLKSGRVVVARPSHYLEASLCRPDEPGFLDCIEEAAVLEVEWR